MEYLESLTKPLSDLIIWGLNEYGVLTYGVLLGVFITWFYHRFLGTRLLRKSYERTIVGKNETIDAYKMLLLERLNKIKIDREDLGIIKSLKRFFKSNALNNK